MTTFALSIFLGLIGGLIGAWLAREGRARQEQRRAIDDPYRGELPPLPPAPEYDRPFPSRPRRAYPFRRDEVN